MLTGKKGTAASFKLDWSMAEGTYPRDNGRMLIQGTKGFIEIRKHANPVSEDDGRGQVLVVNDHGEKHYNAVGVTGYPFFGQLILDCLNRTEKAMTQDHIFKAAELCMRAQTQAVRIR